MKKSHLLLFCIILCSTIVLAQLEDFPDNFISGGSFDGYIVVGKDGTSTDVLSQSMLGLKIQSYLGSLQRGINKLDTEVDIDNNLILIGNPCVNTLTSELLDSPEICDGDFPLGKAYIRYYEKDGYNYIVVAGNNDVSTKRAAQELTDFDINDLEGSEFVIDIPGELASKEVSGMPKEGMIAPVPELYDDGTGDGKEEDESGKDIHEPVLISDQDDTSETEGGEESSESSELDVIIVQDEGIFQKVWQWFRGLFGK